MREIVPSERIKNFDEVALGYNLTEAKIEASRCLNCKTAPCITGCPVKINIPAFINEVKNGKIEQAYKIINDANLLPSICGRVCPQEAQCEAKCVCGIKGEPIAIGRLERFVGDYFHHQPIKTKKIGGRIAVVGSGPAGLTCGGELARLGREVHVFEALHALGGVLIYGIPEFRLPKRIVQIEINQLKELGVQFHLNAVIGKTHTVDELLARYDAVFIGTGAGLPKFMGIPGENLNGVFSANEFLTRINLMKANRKDYDTPLWPARQVVVIGGGNVAMDAARAARRLGAEVTVLYRRGYEEMPARREEVDHALEEGIKFHFLVSPTAVCGKAGFVKAVDCVKMCLREPDATGRRRPQPIPGSDFTVSADTVIMALGNHPNPLLTAATPQLKTDRWGCLVVDDNLMTSLKGVFAGGDAVTGAATVIMAMAAGKKAATAINCYLNK